jgi:UDP-glucose 4-epimerase
MASLVTGATGFIGKHLVAELASGGDRVRALYRDEEKRLRHLNRNVETIRGDACDSSAMREAVQGIDVVFHCAAAHSMSPAHEIRRTNVQSVRCLLEAVRDSGGRPRVILMSSLNVLGNGSYSGATEAMPRRRTRDLHVDLKIEAEELAERWIAAGVDIVILRPGLVYGAGDPHVPKLARAIYRGKFVFIGSRAHVVPLIHISDMVQAMRLAAQAPPGVSRVFNLTDGSATSIGDFVASVARALVCPVPTRVLPAAVPRLAVSVCGLLGRDGPISRSALRFLGTSRHVDIGRARAELGFRPSVSMDQGVEAMQSWLRQAVAAKSAA